MIKVRIRYATSNPNGRTSHRDEDVQNIRGQFRLGRQPDCDIFLRDLAIHDHEATVSVRDNDVLIESHHSGSMELEGLATDRAVLTQDSPVRIGPYQIGLLGSEPDAPVVVGIQHSLADADQALAKLMPSGKQTLSSSVWFGKRAAAWLFFLALAVVGLALPIAGFVASQKDATEAHGGTQLASFDNWWISGELSDSHKYLNDRCEDCHVKPFVPVEDNACIACHEDTGHHFDTQLFTISDAAEGGCTSCHGEHQGPTGSVPAHQSLCTDCHADLTDQEPKTTLINASDFGTDHPEFRPSVMVDPANMTVVRATLGEPDFPAENSNLKFPHNIHIGPDTKDVVKKWIVEQNAASNAYDGRDMLVCADCHLPDPGGASMAKVNMNEHCADCHRLEFDQEAKGRVLPHGQPDEVIGVINDYYIAKALTRLEASEQQPTQQQKSFQQRAGSNPSQAAVRRATLAAAQEEVDRNLAGIFGGRLCSQCHNVFSPDQSASGEWEVAPIFVTRVWQPKSVFDHESHESVDCAGCHAAEQSKTSADVLLPDIASCRECHEGESAQTALPSTCGMCHVYHFDDLAPISATASNPHQLPVVAGMVEAGKTEQ